MCNEREWYRKMSLEILDKVIAKADKAGVKPMRFDSHPCLIGIGIPDLRYWEPVLENELVATKYHLEDMRSLVFKEEDQDE